MNKFFWVKWKNEYLHSLQQRTKRKINRRNSFIEKWELSSIKMAFRKMEKAHKRNDDMVRVAKVKMQEGFVPVPLQKIVRWKE